MENKLLLIFTCIFLCICLSSCNKNEDSPLVYNDTQALIDDIEGMYIATFTNEMHNGTYDRQGTSYTGNINVKKQSGGTYSLDIVCDDYGLRLRFEGIEPYAYSSYSDEVSLSHYTYPNNYKEIDELWTILFNVYRTGKFSDLCGWKLHTRGLNFANRSLCFFDIP